MGHHALSVAVLGSYLNSFADGRIEAAFYNVKASGHVAKLRRDLSV